MLQAEIDDGFVDTSGLVGPDDGTYRHIDKNHPLKMRGAKHRNKRQNRLKC
jgi:hypothetical protein